MKKLLLKRILPLVMAIVMLASFCLPIGALSFGSSATDDEGTPYYTIEFKDGVLRVKLNPQKIYDMVSDGSVTREELEDFLPSEVLAVLDGEASVDTLLTFVTEQLSADELEELTSALPKDILTRYFLNVEFLEKLVALDEVVSMIDLNAILAEVEDKEAFNNDLNRLLTPVLSDLLTENVQKKLLNDPTFMETVLADALDRMLAEHEAEVMSKLPVLLTDQVLDQILGNAQYTDAIVGAVGDDLKLKVMNNEALRQKLANYMMSFVPAKGETMTDDNPLKKLMADEDVLAQVKLHPEWFMTEEVIEYIFKTKKDVLTNDALIKIFTEDELRKLIKKNDYAVVKELLSDKTLIDGLIKDPEFPDVASIVVTDKVVDLLTESETFDVSDYFTNDRLAQLLAGKTLNLTNAVKPDASQDEISAFVVKYKTTITANLLIHNGHLKLEKINVSALGLNNKDIYDLLTEEEKDAVAEKFGIDQNYFQGKLTPEQWVELVANDWGLDDLIQKGWIKIDDVALEKGITPQSLLEAGIFPSLDAMLKRCSALISLESILNIEGALDVAAILNESTYELSLADILNSGLVNVSGVLSANGIKISELNLSSGELTGIAKDALEIEGVREELKSSFLAQIRKGDEEGSDAEDAIDPIEFFRHVKLADVAASENVNLSALIHELVDPMEGDSEEVLAIKEKRIRDLANLVQLTTKDYEAIFASLDRDGYEELVGQLKEHSSEIISKTGMMPFVRCFGAVNLINALFATETQSGMMVLITNGTLDYNEIATAIGGVHLPDGTDEQKKSKGLSVLASMMDTKLVVKELGDLLMQYVTVEQIVSYAGGYNVVLGWYSSDELSGMIEKIGTDKLVKLVKDHELYKSSAAREAATAIAKKLFAENGALVIEEMKKSFMMILVEEIGSISINDTVIFKNGMMDIEAAVRAFLLSIPDLERFCEMKAGDPIVGMVLHTDFRNDPDTSLGFEICFDGDFTQLQRLVEKYQDLFDIEVGKDDLDFHVSSVLPSKVMALYEALLESESLPATLRGTILMTPSLSLPGLVEMLTTFTDEELEALSNAVNENLGSVLESADSATGSLPEGVRDPVDSTLESLRTPDGWKKLTEQIQGLANKLPEPIKSYSIESMYDGAGHFTLPSFTYSLDLTDKLSSSLGLPAGMLNADLSGTFSSEVTFRNLYSLTLDYRQGGKIVLLLPAGTSLDILKDVRGLDLSVFGDKIPDVMPAWDTVVTPVLKDDECELTFIYHLPNGQKVEERIVYHKDATKLPYEPTAPTVRGYHPVFGEYKLGEKQYQTVHVTYELTTYTLVFQNGTETYTRSFNIKTIHALTLPDVGEPARGYRYDWVFKGKTWTLEDIKSYLLDVTKPLNGLGPFVLVTSLEIYQIYFYNLDNILIHTSNYTIEGWVNSASDYVYPLSDGYQWWIDADNRPLTVNGFFDFTLAKDIVAKQRVKQYYFLFRYLEENNREDVMVSFSPETTFDEFMEMIPDPSPATSNYRHEWAIDGDWETFFLENKGKEGVVIYERRIYTKHKITFDYLDPEKKDQTLEYTAETKWADLVTPDPTAETRAMKYGWYVDLNGNGRYDGSMEDWCEANFNPNTGADITVKEYAEYKIYTYTFHTLDGQTHTILVSAETQRQEFMAAVNALHTEAPAGYAHVWLDADGTEWWPQQFIEGSDAMLDNFEFFESRKEIPSTQYTITFIPLKNNTSGVAGEPVLVSYYGYTTKLEGVPELHKVVIGENEKLYLEYFWYVDRNGNATYDDGDLRWDPATEFDAAVCRDFEVREYGLAQNYTVTLKPFNSSYRQDVVYNANIWPEVYRQLCDMLTVPTGDEIGSYGYGWYYQDENGRWVKQGFPQTLTNENVQLFRRALTELRRVLDCNVIYVYDKDGALLSEYFYAYDGVFYRDLHGNEVRISSLLAPPAIEYNDFAGWYYAGKGFDPARTDKLFSIETFVDDLNIDLLNDSVSKRRINVMPAYVLHEYTIIFKDLAQNVIGTVVYNIDGIVSGAAPFLPTLNDGYLYDWWNVTANKKWEGVDYGTPEDLEVVLVRTPIRYTLTFHLPEGESEDTAIRYYTVEDHSYELPSIKIPAGTVAQWYYMDGDRKVIWQKGDATVGDLDLFCEFTKITYTVTFLRDGASAVVLLMTSDAKDQPEITAKPFYTGVWRVQLGEAPSASDPEWSEYDLAGGEEEVTVYVDYTAKSYRVSFMMPDGSVVEKRYTIEDAWTPIALPEDVAAGYEYRWFIGEVEWQDYQLTDTDEAIEVVAKQLPLEYTIRFLYPDGTVVEVKTTVGEKPDPAADAGRLGYRGAWLVQLGETPADNDPLFKDYSLAEGARTLTVYMKLTPIEYKVTFVHPDGSEESYTLTVEMEKPIPEFQGGAFGSEYSWYVELGETDAPWNEYVLTDSETESLTVYAKTESTGLLFGMFWGWWVLILILIILIALAMVYFFVIRARKLAKAVAEAIDSDEDDGAAEGVTETDAEAEGTESGDESDSTDADAIAMAAAAAAAQAAMMASRAAASAARKKKAGGVSAKGYESFINVDDINAAFDEGDTVDMDALKAKNLISAKTDRVKILADGCLNKSLTIVADSFSKQAIEKIILAGGKAIQRKIKQ